MLIACTGLKDIATKFINLNFQRCVGKYRFIIANTKLFNDAWWEKYLLKFNVETYSQTILKIPQVIKCNWCPHLFNKIGGGEWGPRTKLIQLI